MNKTSVINLSFAELAQGVAKVKVSERNCHLWDIFMSAIIGNFQKYILIALRENVSLRNIQPVKIQIRQQVS